MVDLPRPVAPEKGKKKENGKKRDCDQLSGQFLKPTAAYDYIA